MNIHWVSPLPPARTDIGHYTARVLPSLAELADVTLWTEQADWDPALEDLARVRRFRLGYEMPWKEFNRSDAVFYNMGNNVEFHGPIWEISRHHPGIKIIHDPRLHEFFTGVFKPMRGGHEAYLNVMERYYGEAGREDGDRWWHGHVDPYAMVERYPLTPFALEGALAGVVHTQYASSLLAESYSGPLLTAPLPYQSTPRPRAGRRGREAGRPQAEPYRLVVFGYIGPNRRLESILAAWARMPERDRFRLDIFGQLWNADAVAGRVRSLGLQNLVTIRGFVPEPELDVALDAADLAFNLRYPTMGEASATQLRIWNHALPSVVTRVGMYADLPDDTVAFVDPDREVEQIQSHLRAFLDDPSKFSRMGAKGRRILEEQHAPDAYARALIDFASNAPYLRRRAATLRLADRVGSEVGSWASPEISERFAASIAREIWPLIGEVRTANHDEDGRAPKSHRPVDGKPLDSADLTRQAPHRPEPVRSLERRAMR